MQSLGLLILPTKKDSMESGFYYKTYKEQTQRKIGVWDHENGSGLITIKDVMVWVEGSGSDE